MYIEFNGLSFGDGSLYNITSIDGLDSLPDLTIGMAPKPRRHGSWLGGKLAQKRVITMSFEIHPDPGDDYRTTRPKNAMVEAFQIMDEELPLTFDLGYGEQPVLVYASVTSLDLPIGQNYTRLRTGSVEFTCTDPHKYTASSKKGRARVPETPPATPYGADYGFAYSITTGLSGTFKAVNEGNTASPAVYSIHGPVTNPILTLTDSKGTRRTRFAIRLKQGDTLTVDVARNRVSLDGENKYGTASGALVANLTIRPGTTTVHFTGNDTGGEIPPSLTAEWRDTFR